MALFLMNALAGRIWCGYLCPQTVWTDLFQTIERWTEGDRREHHAARCAAAGPSSASRALGPQAFPLADGRVVDRRRLGALFRRRADAGEAISRRCEAPFVAYLWIGILTFTTYALAGHMREQVCLYMCPWPRIQAALTDEHALNVTYRYDRGEPRGSVKKSRRVARAGPAGRRLHRLPAMRARLPDRRRHPQRAESRLHPVRAVHRCLRRRDGEDRPAGAADRLRHRPQHQARGRRASADLQASCACAPRSMPRSSRVVGGVMTLHAGDARQRKASASSTTAIRCSCGLSDGAIRNAYTVRIVNKRSERREFTLSIDGPRRLAARSSVQTARRRPLRRSRSARTRRARCASLVTDYADLPPASTPITFHLYDVMTGERRSRRRLFPRPLQEDDNDMPPTTSRACAQLTGRTVLLLPGRVLRRRARRQWHHDPRRGLDLQRRRNRELLSGRPGLRARGRGGATRRTRCIGR